MGGRGKFDNDTLTGGLHGQGRSGVGHEFACVRQHGFNPGVVVFGVMMEEKEFFDFRFQRERDGVIHTAMAPADMALVFFGVVLRIKDQDLGAAQKAGGAFLLFLRIIGRGPGIVGRREQRFVLAAVRGKMPPSRDR